MNPKLVAGYERKKFYEDLSKYTLKCAGVEDLQVLEISRSNFLRYFSRMDKVEKDLVELRMPKIIRARIKHVVSKSAD